MPRIAARLPPISLVPATSAAKGEECAAKGAPSSQHPPSSSLVAPHWMLKRSPEDFPPTPRAPTPYRPGRVALRPKRSVLPALFEMKLEVPRRRDSTFRTMLEAERRMEERYQGSLPKKTCRRLLRLPDAPVEATDTAAADVVTFSSPPAAEDPKEVAPPEYSSADQAMRECFLLEAIQEQVMREETQGRIFIKAEENYYYTTILVDSSHSLMEALAESDEDLVVDIRHAAASREEERTVFFHEIAERIHVKFHEKCLREKLQSIVDEELSLYTTAMKEMQATEAEEWKELIAWHERRMKSYGQTLHNSKTRDYRITKKTKKTKRRKYGNRSGSSAKESSTERAIRVLREKKTAEFQLVLFHAHDAKETSNEELFALNGQEAHQREKERKDAERYHNRRLDRLQDEELVAREALQKLESQKWIPLMLFGIDGYYEAKRSTRERLEMEELQRRKEAGDAVARAEIKRRLLAKEFSERNQEEQLAAVSSWTPDVIP